MLYNDTVTIHVANAARDSLAKRLNISPEGLTYIGFTDCGVLQEGWNQLLFNVMVKCDTVPIGGTVGFDHGKE